MLIAVKHSDGGRPHSTRLKCKQEQHLSCPGLANACPAPAFHTIDILIEIREDILQWTLLSWESLTHSCPCTWRLITAVLSAARSYFGCHKDDFSSKDVGKIESCRTPWLTSVSPNMVSILCLGPWSNGALLPKGQTLILKSASWQQRDTQRSYSLHKCVMMRSV